MIDNYDLNRLNVIRSGHCQVLDDYKDRFDFLTMSTKRFKNQAAVNSCKLTTESAQDQFKMLEAYQLSRKDLEISHKKVKRDLLESIHQEVKETLPEKEVLDRQLSGFLDVYKYFRPLCKVLIS